MKKKICSILLLSLALGFVFAQETKNDSQKILDSIIAYESECAEVAAGIPVLLNSIIGFGIGSYVQGDKLSIVGTVGDLLSYVMLGVGIPLWIYQTGDAETAGIVLTVFGSLFYTSSKLFQLFRPFVFEKSEKERLSNKYFADTITMSLAPIVDFSNKDIGLACKFNI